MCSFLRVCMRIIVRICVVGGKKKDRQRESEHERNMINIVTVML